MIICVKYGCHRSLFHYRIFVNLNGVLWISDTVLMCFEVFLGFHVHVFYSGARSIESMS